MDSGPTWHNCVLQMLIKLPADDTGLFLQSYLAPAVRQHRLNACSPNQEQTKIYNDFNDQFPPTQKKEKILKPLFPQRKQGTEPWDILLSLSPRHFTGQDWTHETHRNKLLFPDITEDTIKGERPLSAAPSPGCSGTRTVCQRGAPASPPAVLTALGGRGPWGTAVTAPVPESRLAQTLRMERALPNQQQPSPPSHGAHRLTLALRAVKRKYSHGLYLCFHLQQRGSHLLHF